MRRKIIIFLLAFMLFIPVNILALSNNYVDKVSGITNSKVEENKVNLYLFHGKECPHCAEEKQWLKKIKKEYKDVLNIYMFEVWHNDDNATMLEEVKAVFKTDARGVPFTVIGDNYYVGYSSTSASMMEAKIKEYTKDVRSSNEAKLPILGKVNLKNVSIPLVAIVLGFIDGFNPCAMWILLFLINMLFGMEDKKKAWVLGFTFLLVSGLVYFISMLGINLVLGVATTVILRTLIAIFILVAGILNFRKYLKKRKEDDGCDVVDDKKRKKMVKRMKNIMNSKTFILALLGIIVLAASVNLIELACSLGFPVIFTELLNLNNVTGCLKILYLLLYVLFYMIDDIAVFSISMFTLEATGITNKYSKLTTLISSIIMILMGILLIIKPEWLMLNF